MNANGMLYLSDYLGRQVRLTHERMEHLFLHPEMVGEVPRLQETLLQPDLVISTIADPDVLVYHRFYHSTPVTSKYLLVVVKHELSDFFVLTAFFSNRQKKGRILWQK